MERRAADTQVDTLKRALGSVVLRRGLEVNASELPPLIEAVVCCYLTPLQRDLYERIVASYRKQDSLPVLTLLERTCAHPSLIYYAETAGTPTDLATVWPNGFNPLGRDLWQWSGKMQVRLYSCRCR